MGCSYLEKAISIPCLGLRWLFFFAFIPTMPLRSYMRSGNRLLIYFLGCLLGK